MRNQGGAANAQPAQERATIDIEKPSIQTEPTSLRVALSEADLYSTVRTISSPASMIRP